jgi:hypothetical protein
VTQPSGNNKIKLTLSPEAEKYVRRDAPQSVRLMAASGALPLQPIELASVLFALMHDPDAPVKERALQSLVGLPEHILDQVLSGPAHPIILAFFAEQLHNQEAPCEKLALNPATADNTIAYLAAQPHMRVVDIISNNQERLMRCEAILDSLGENPLAGRAVIQRILAFLGIRQPEDDAADDDLENPDDLSDEDAESAVAALLGEEYAHLANLLASESHEEISDEELKGNLFALIQEMTVMQKIKLARSGGKEARGLLIRDRNKVVYTAVIMSPKITENEVVTISQNRNSPEEVLRIVSMNRDYTKHYQVKRGLATNPRTPQPTALKFLNYLQDRDLRQITKSREVSSVVSTQARRILTKKGKV